MTVLEIVVQRLDGLPVFCVPMPSRHEKCRFVLKPLANTLSDFVSFLKLEDSAIEHVEAYTEGGLTRSLNILFLFKFICNATVLSEY